MQDDFYCQDCFASFFLFERDYIRSFVSFVIFVGFFLDFEDHTKQSFFFCADPNTCFSHVLTKFDKFPVDPVNEK